MKTFELVIAKPPLAFVVPGPVMAPADQLKRPETSRTAAPPSVPEARLSSLATLLALTFAVPPLIVNVPTVSGAATFSVPPEIKSVPVVVD